MEFDIYDKQEGRFFSTRKRREFLEAAPFVKSVRVLAQGYYKSAEEIARWIGPSLFISEQRREHFSMQCARSGAEEELSAKQTDLTGIMEGIYIKVEDGDYVTDRLKYVRASFLNTILDSDSHWVNRPIVPNCLADDVQLFE